MFSSNKSVVMFAMASLAVDLRFAIVCFFVEICGRLVTTPMTSELIFGHQTNSVVLGQQFQECIGS